jgi:hypothetical protein
VEDAMMTTASHGMGASVEGRTQSSIARASAASGSATARPAARSPLPAAQRRLSRPRHARAVPKRRSFACHAGGRRNSRAARPARGRQARSVVTSAAQRRIPEEPSARRSGRIMDACDDASSTR